jgi:hypothetical protein
VPPAPIDPAANAAQLSTRSLAAPAIRDALTAHGIAAPAGHAWSLDQLTLAAWLLRADLATARTEVDAARAKTGVEARRPNPNVNMTNEKVTDSGAANPWVVGAALAKTYDHARKSDNRPEPAHSKHHAPQIRSAESLRAASTH